MNYTIELANKGDAKDMLRYLKTIGSESDYLLFGKDGVPMTLEQEEVFLDKVNKTPYSRMFIIKENNKIIANGSLQVNPRERIKHKATIAMSVAKPQWGKGLGSLLMEALIAYAKSTNFIETIYLEVVSENTRAIKLYEKYGFISYGTNRRAFKVNDTYYDWLLMRLDIKK